MEYKVNELAQLSGVSARTLRYYDEIGLLAPLRTEQNGYRVYGNEQVNRLQQILFYRELGVPLDEISAILANPGFDRQRSLEAHLVALQKKRERIDALIKNVTTTIRSMKEDIIMSDKEKFEGFKHGLVEENERKYGDEAASKYGRDALDASNKKVLDMTQDQWDEQQRLCEGIFEQLREAMKSGDPMCEAARRAADMHRQWLCLFWKDGTYSKQAHICLAQGYVSDSRFVEYYDSRCGAGATELLAQAIAQAYFDENIPSSN